MLLGVAAGCRVYLKTGATQKQAHTVKVQGRLLVLVRLKIACAADVTHLLERLPMLALGAGKIEEQVRYFNLHLMRTCRVQVVPKPAPNVRGLGAGATMT